MKITKEGRNPKDRKWVCSCRTCGAEAEAEEHELHNIVADPMRGNDAICWMPCPCCGANAELLGMLFYPKHGWTAQR